MEPWLCHRGKYDIRTVSEFSPHFAKRSMKDQTLDADSFLGTFVDYQLENEPESGLGFNEDGTREVTLIARSKVEDDRGVQFYVRNEEMPFDEDRYHEFKGHRSLAKDECPRSTQSAELDELDSTRKPVSSTLAAFLNTHAGGTLFLGVLDNGRVKGTLLTARQKEHVVGNVVDLFSRFSPPVPRSRWRIRFVPVLDKNWLDDDLKFIRLVQRLECGRPNAVHRYRTGDFCWCDREAMKCVQSQSGIPPLPYVIELEILPFSEERPEDFLTLYSDENGRVFVRANASNKQPMVSEIVQYLRYRVDEKCKQMQGLGKLESFLDSVGGCQRGRRDITSKGW